MSVNRKIKEEKFEPEIKIENTMSSSSAAPKSNLKHKQVFTYSIYPPSGSKHQENLFTKWSVPGSTLHQAPTNTLFFASITSMDQLTSDQILAKIHTEKN